MIERFEPAMREFIRANHWFGAASEAKESA